MTKDIEWTNETYSRSVTSECWWFTPYHKDDPSYWESVSKDEEMKEIVTMEQSLDEIPEWSRSVGIDYLPPCGLYDFPKALLQVVSLIGSADQALIDQTFKHQCYAVERDRKQAAEDYCLCLDAWLAGADPQPVAAELTALGRRKVNWLKVCADLWDVLGERDEKKELLVERLLEAIRYAIKASKWDDERGTEFGRDLYVGDYVQLPNGDASYSVLSSPRVKRIEEQLSSLDPEWHRFIGVDLGFWWLCAPKAFRFLDRDLWAIGNDRRPEKGEQIPGFLQCEDTYPNRDHAAKWYSEFCAALDAWWQGNRPTGSTGDLVCQRLGDDSPVKRWLVRLFLKKLRTYEATGGSIGLLVNPGARQKWGTRPIEIG
jgi:hypothetical protein